MSRKSRNSRYIISTILLILLVFLPSQTIFANVWSDLKAGDNALANKNYDLAIQKYKKVIPQFVKEKNHTNTALIYGRLGQAYAHLQKYDDAAKSWRLEAEYWGKIPNRDQEQIAANRKADYVQSDIRLFAEVNGEAASDRFYHGAKYEPVLGAYIGAYAENDSAVHDPYNPNKFYMEKFPELTGKKHASYLIYFTYGKPLSSYQSHFKKAKQNQVAMQIAVEPLNGLDQVKDDAYLRSLAKEAGEAGVPIFLRFANEMNDPTNPWFTDPKTYIEKYRLVSKVFKEEAPNVAMVWAPNSFPPNTIHDYYPGDAYVDWIGLSMYKTHVPHLDPLKQNVDRESYVKKFDTFYKMYSTRKPVFISEGAISYTNIYTGANVTNWAAKELENFFTYLPMLYPNIKAYYYFSSNNIVNDRSITRSFRLSGNETVLNAYKRGINNPFYLSNIDDTSPVFYPDVSQYGIAPRTQTLHSFVKTAEPNITKVVYKLNGKTIGTAAKAPWTIQHNFVQYPGKRVTITVEAYAGQKLIASKKIPVDVGKVNVTLDGHTIDFDAQPLLVKNRTFIPIRQLAEAADAKVTWHGSTQSFTIEKGTGKMTLTLGSKTAIINGKQVTLETAPFLENNRSYLPLRVISEELLDLDVEWNQGTQSAVLSSMK